MLVYIAGPYTNDQTEGVRLAVEAAEQIIKAGGTPLVPHLCHLWQLISPHSWRWWMELDFKLLDHCDVLYRLAGKSTGADLEVVHAEQRGIPVYWTWRALEVALEEAKL